MPILVAVGGGEDAGGMCKVAGTAAGGTGGGFSPGGGEVPGGTAKGMI
jgi:hypothetical protein